MEKTFVSIKYASGELHISDYALRCMVKEGKVPHIKVGCKTLINLPRFIEYLDKESCRAVTESN